MNKLMILLVLATTISGVAQEKNAEIEEPKGRTITEVFGNFHTGFGSGNGAGGFALERCYLGYEYHLGNVTAAKRTSRLSRGKVRTCGMTNRTRNAIKMWKPVGLRNVKSKLIDTYVVTDICFVLSRLCVISQNG